MLHGMLRRVRLTAPDEMPSVATIGEHALKSSVKQKIENTLLLPRRLPKLIGLLREGEEGHDEDTATRDEPRGRPPDLEVDDLAQHRDETPPDESHGKGRQLHLKPARMTTQNAIILSRRDNPSHGDEHEEEKNEDLERQGPEYDL